MSYFGGVGSSMTHDESYYKTKLVKEGRRFGDYARRMEDKYAVGLPDILYGPNVHPSGATCLIEAKMINGATTFAPTPRQYVDLLRFDGPGRASLMLGFQDGRYFIHNYADVILVKDCLVSDPGEPFPLFIRRFLK